MLHCLSIYLLMDSWVVFILVIVDNAGIKVSPGSQFFVHVYIYDCLPYYVKLFKLYLTFWRNHVIIFHNGSMTFVLFMF